MLFNVKLTDGSQEKLSIKVNDNWSKINTSSTFLSSLFLEIDNKDDIVSYSELNTLANILKSTNFDKCKKNTVDVEDSYLIEYYNGDCSGDIIQRDIILNLLNSDTNNNRINLNKFELSEHIHRLNEENIVNIFYRYQDMYESDIFSDILNMNNLGPEEKISYCKYIIEKLTESVKNVEDVKDIIDKLNSELNKGSKADGKILNLQVLKLFKDDPRSIARFISNDLASINLNMDKFNQHLDLVNEYNVHKVLFLYQRKQNIFSDIVNSDDMKREDKIKYCKKILEIYLSFAKNNNVYIDDIVEFLYNETEYQQSTKKSLKAEVFSSISEKINKRFVMRFKEGNNEYPNGKIDLDFEQGHMGDCWFLAAIKAISNNPDTKKILEDSIKVLEDGSVSVTLQGVGKTYIISRAELEGANEFATGDLDVRALEIAADKYMRESYHNDKTLRKYPGFDIEDNTPDKAFEILLGVKNSCPIFNDFVNDLRTLTKSFINKIKNGKYLICAETHKEIKHPVSIEGANGEYEEICSYHAYTIVDADDKFIYVVNPMDTSNTLKISHKDAKKAFDKLGCVNIKEVEKMQKNKGLSLVM